MEYVQIQEFIVDHEQQIQYAVCKKITVVNAQDDIKEILFIDEQDSFVDTDELLISCVHITVAEHRSICAVPKKYLTL